MDFNKELAKIYDRLKLLIWFYYPYDKYQGEELLQETVLTMIRFKDKYQVQEGASLYSWGSIVMRNTFINRHRADSRQPDLVKSTTQSGDIFSRLEIYAPDCEENLLARELLDVITKNSLEMQSDCLLLFADGYTYEDIADMKGIPVGTVKSRIHLARKKIKNKLDDARY